MDLSKDLCHMQDLCCEIKSDLLFRMGKKQHLSQTKCRNRLAPFWLICSLVVWHKQLPLFNSNNHTPHFVLFSPTLNLAFHGLVSCWFRWVQWVWARASRTRHWTEIWILTQVRVVETKTFPWRGLVRSVMNKRWQKITSLTPRPAIQECYNYHSVNFAGHVEIIKSETFGT